MVNHSNSEQLYSDVKGAINRFGAGEATVSETSHLITDAISSASCDTIKEMVKNHSNEASIVKENGKEFLEFKAPLFSDTKTSFGAEIDAKQCKN